MNQTHRKPFSSAEPGPKSKIHRTHPIQSHPIMTGVSDPLEEEMNSLLSSSSFSVASYLNLALKDQTDSDVLQRRMTEVALQLQLQTQSCHENIGRIGAELQAILPRCAADVGRVGVGLDGMKLDASTLLETTGMGDDDSGGMSSSLETLSTLHALQANLTKTKTVLTAAATWDSTIGSVAPLLAEQNLAGAVNALAQLEAGERSLRGMPYGEDRRDSIREIREQVQALLQPQLKHALQNMNTRLAPLQQCVALYSKLGTMESLREDYIKQRPGAVHKAWFSYAPPKNAFRGTGGDGGDGGDGDGDGPAASDEKVAGGENVGESFMAWLPTWYETVLSLLTEEVRQASTVFGPTEAPEIVVRVLREAFRPILPSYQSRLEMVFSTTVNAGSTTSGSFETLCTIYESTLRFLSLIYDLIAGAFLDLVESGVSNMSAGIDLYKILRDVFLQVASPFAPYMQNFADLEGKHSRVVAGTVSNDIRKTAMSASSASMNLETLQDATNNLKDLASFVFPIVDGSLDRFQLLNGGYRANEVLKTVDTVLSNHLEELITAIRSLSAAMTADADRLVTGFDEQHVLCTMDVLKIAGNFRRDLRNFEGGTRTRMKSLAERMKEHDAQEAGFRSIAESTNKQKKSSFSLSDSLSIVEIDCYLTKVFCGDSSSSGSDDIETNPSVADLERICSGTSSREDTVFSNTADVMKRFENSCHSFVFDVCSAVPNRHLAGLPQMPAWSESASAMDDPYGTLPQQYITQVGEHMLSLVQAFEPFASDPAALSLVNEAMTGVETVAMQPWSEFTGAAGLDGSDAVVSGLMNGKEIADLVLANAALGEEDAELEDGATDEERASAAFCNAWLDVIGLAITGRLLEKIVRIPRLTPKGCDHLTADLNYLVNVFSALGVAGHPHPLVTHMGTLATLSDRDLEAQIRSRNTSSELENALRAVEARLALRRGISIS